MQNEGYDTFGVLYHIIIRLRYTAQLKCIMHIKVQFSGALPTDYYDRGPQKC